MDSKSYLSQALDKEKSAMALHLPGYNYLGPGTPVVTNIINRIKPVDRNDAVAMQHDIDYLKGDNRYWSDLKAIFRSQPGFAGMALRLGLTVRMIADMLTAYSPLNGLVRFDRPLLEPTNNEALVKVLENEAKDWELW